MVERADDPTTALGGDDADETPLGRGIAIGAGLEAALH